MNSVNPKVTPGGSAIGQQALAGQSAQGKQLAGQGTGLFNQGMPQLQQSGKYFSTLAGGNRAAMTQALSPEIESTNAVYGGATKTLSRFLRGPEKDVQLAETERERAGAIGRLFGQGRTAANANLASVGAGNVGAGMQASGAAGSMFGSVARTSQDAQIEQNKEQMQAGQGFGGLLFNVLKSFTPLGRIGAP